MSRAAMFTVEGCSSFENRLLDPPSDPRYLGRLGRYDVLVPPSYGGMGIVFRAYDAVLDREVAIKMLSPHLADRPIARERFAREARAAATICHENVVSIYTVAETAGLPYLVMPYVAGRSLAEKLQCEGRLEIESVLRIGLEIALGLEAAHGRGVVHRDIKPSNLLLEGTAERVKIADFGLALVVDGSDLTESGTMAGMPEFTSPEQAGGGPVDARCDLFSLGAVLYAATTGRSPFRADTPLAAVRRVCDETPPPVTLENPEATAWLAATIERLLEKNPDDRYQRAADVAESFRRQLATYSRRRRPRPRAAKASPARIAPLTAMPVAVPAIALTLPSATPTELVAPSDPPEVAMAPPSSVAPVVYSCPPAVGPPSPGTPAPAVIVRGDAVRNSRFAVRNSTVRRAVVLSAAVAILATPVLLLWADLAGALRSRCETELPANEKQPAAADASPSVLASPVATGASTTPSMAVSTTTTSIGIVSMGRTPDLPKPFLVLPAETIALPSIPSPTVAPPAAKPPVTLLSGSVPAAVVARGAPGKPPVGRPFVAVVEREAVLGIDGITPTTGPPGQPIRITGRGLRQTKKVALFIGSARKQADFKIDEQDGSLVVTAPDCLEDGAEAVIVVETDAGVAVSLPAEANVVADASDAAPLDAPNFTMVLGRGETSERRGVVVVEQGGKLKSFPAFQRQFGFRYGPYFVMNGARVEETLPPNVHMRHYVYHQPKAQFGPKPHPLAKMIPAERIALSSMGLFRYVARPNAQVVTNERGPAWVGRIDPAAARPGDVIALFGGRFGGTRRVVFLEKRTARYVDAPFRIVDDGVLHVEVPDDLEAFDEADGEPASGHGLIIVGAGGTAFTVGHGEIRKINRATSDAFPFDTFRWIESGGTGRSGPWCFAESGGHVSDCEEASALFVKRGAKVASNYRPGTLICIESAGVSPDLRAAGHRAGGPVLIETPEILPSVIDFRVLHPNE